MGFTTVGGKTQTIIPRQEDYSIDVTFTATAGTSIPTGSMAKIKTGGVDGEIEIVSAVTDDAIGIVSVGTKSVYKDEQQVTIKTPFVAVIYAEAKVAIAYGDKVNQAGLSTDNPVQPLYDKVTAGDAYYGIALESGGVGDTIAIGILRQSKTA